MTYKTAVPVDTHQVITHAISLLDPSISVENLNEANTSFSLTTEDPVTGQSVDLEFIVANDEHLSDFHSYSTVSRTYDNNISITTKDKKKIKKKATRDDHGRLKHNTNLSHIIDENNKNDVYTGVILVKDYANGFNRVLRSKTKNPKDIKRAKINAGLFTDIKSKLEILYPENNGFSIDNQIYDIIKPRRTEVKAMRMAEKSDMPLTYFQSESPRNESGFRFYEATHMTGGKKDQVLSECKTIPINKHDGGVFYQSEHGNFIYHAANKLSTMKRKDFEFSEKDKKSLYSVEALENNIKNYEFMHELPISTASNQMKSFILDNIDNKIYDLMDEKNKILESLESSEQESLESNLSYMFNDNIAGIEEELYYLGKERDMYQSGEVPLKIVLDHKNKFAYLVPSTFEKDNIYSREQKKEFSIVSNF